MGPRGQDGTDIDQFSFITSDNFVWHGEHFFGTRPALVIDNWLAMRIMALIHETLVCLLSHLRQPHLEWPESAPITKTSKRSISKLSLNQGPHLPFSKITESSNI